MSATAPSAVSQQFTDADVDSSGFLEEGEMQKFLTQTNAQDFDWKSLDTDHDSKLSESEFTAASVSQQFTDADLDGSGFLEEEEMQKLVSQTNPQGFNWKSLDTDHDGK